MRKITESLVNDLIREARASERRRKNYNFHDTPEDLMHRMLNALEPGTYVRPHKHENPGKREAFLILKGRVAVVKFSEDGEVADRLLLEAGGENYGVELSPGIYHTIIALQSGSVVYELKDGPWNPATDKHFAPWAPEEGSPEAADYLNRLEKVLTARAQAK